MHDGESAKWFEFTVRTDPVDIERWTAALIERGSVGIWEHAPGVVTAYFPTRSDSRELQDQLKLLLVSLDDPRATVVGPNAVPVEDWTATWKTFFEPLRITPRLVIAPTWSAYRPLPGERVVLLDPGMAFGTGHHETTRACLRFLDRTLLSKPSASVLDLGTGSGILAIAAARLGDGVVIACDADPEAATVAQSNLISNGLTERVVVVAPETAWARGPYDTIVANLDAPALVTGMPRIVSALKDGAVAFLAGILIEQEPMVLQAAACVGLLLAEREREGEWVGLAVRAASHAVDFTGITC